jgi:oligosaccharide repeat unit polymerase
MKKDFFSPVNIYCFSQVLTLGVAYLKLDPAMTDFQAKTWFVWGGALFSFIAGGAVFRFQSRKPPSEFIREDISETYYWKFHFVISFVLLALFLVGVAGLVSIVGNLVIFTENISRWTSNTVDYGWYSQFYASSPLVVLFFAVASFSSVNPYRAMRNISRVIVPLVIILSVLAYPTRTSLFLSTGFVVILANFLWKKISVFFIMVAILLAFLAFVTIASVRAQYGAASLENMALEAMVKMPYIYVANNYWNLDYALNPAPEQHIHSHTYGVDFLASILEYTRVPGAIRTSMGWDNVFNESVMKVEGLNTTGYLWDVYKDFGIPGVFLFPFCFAFFLTFLYERMKTARAPALWMLYTMLIFYTGWWFFIAGFKQGFFWAWIVIILVSGKLCERREKTEIQIK